MKPPVGTDAVKPPAETGAVAGSPADVEKMKDVFDLFFRSRTDTALLLLPEEHSIAVLTKEMGASVAKNILGKEPALRGRENWQLRQELTEAIIMETFRRAKKDIGDERARPRERVKRFGIGAAKVTACLAAAAGVGYLASYFGSNGLGVWAGFIFTGSVTQQRLKYFSSHDLVEKLQARTRGELALLCGATDVAESLTPKRHRYMQNYIESRVQYYVKHRLKAPALQQG